MMFAIEKNKNNSLGVVLLLAFTFFMGVMLSRLLGFVMGMSNGSQLVMTAFGGTAIVFGTMATLADHQRDLSGMQSSCSWAPWSSWSPRWPTSSCNCPR